MTRAPTLSPEDIAARCVKDWLYEMEGYGYRAERLASDIAMSGPSIGRIMPWLVAAYRLADTPQRKEGEATPLDEAARIAAASENGFLAEPSPASQDTPAGTREALLSAVIALEALLKHWPDDHLPPKSVCLQMADAINNGNAILALHPAQTTPAGAREDLVPPEWTGQGTDADFFKLPTSAFSAPMRSGKPWATLRHHIAALHPAQTTEGGAMPCPFCAGPARTFRYNGTEQATCAGSFVDCAGHDVTAPLAMWNRRPAQTTTPEAQGLEVVGTIQSLQARVAAHERTIARMHRQSGTNRTFWVRAAKAALAGDMRELRNRVDMAEAPPVDVVRSVARSTLQGEREL